MSNDESKPVIDCRLPWEPGKKLGEAINRIVPEIKDWVIIRDYDTLYLTAAWYAICQRAIRQVGHDAGWITCWTNAIGCPLQHHKMTCESLDDHYKVAIAREKVYKCQITDITDQAKRWKLSGMFILTHRKALDSVGKFPDKFIGLDNWYNDRLIENGYRIYRMEDLYIYHGYRRDWKRLEAEATA